MYTAPATSVALGFESVTVQFRSTVAVPLVASTLDWAKLSPVTFKLPGTAAFVLTVCAAPGLAVCA